MSKSGKRPSGLITAVLLLQTLLAPALCLAGLSPQAATVAVAGHVMRGSDQSHDQDESPADHARDDICAAIDTLPHAPLLPVPIAALPCWTLSDVTWGTARGLPLTAPSHGPPFRSTGPPGALS